MPRLETTDTTRPPTPSRGQDSTYYRDWDDRGESGRGGTGRGRSDDRRGRGDSGSVHFDKGIYQGKGTGRTDIITHLSCNCGESDTHSSYRQCLVSIRASTTYFTALTLFDTGSYTSFVNREVAKWLEGQRDNGKTDVDGTSSRKLSRHDTPTATVG